MKFKFTEQALQLMELTSNKEAFATALDFTPRQGTPNSSGYDLSACITSSITLLANEEVKIGTGVHIWIGSEPIMDGEQLDRNIKVAGFLMPRSSIKGCMLTNTVGLCDDDYQGEYMVSLWNRTDSTIVIKPGQKLIQLVYIFTFLPVMELVEDFGNTTTRGEHGFGSTS